MDKPRFRIVEKRGVFRIENEVYEKIRTSVDFEVKKNGWFRREVNRKETYGYIPKGWKTLGQEIQIASENKLEWVASSEAEYRGSNLREGYVFYQHKPYEFDSYEKAYECLVKWEGQAVHLVEPEWKVA